MIQIRHVLCPVDFSDVSRRALDHAIAVAEWYGAHLSVTYVHHAPLATLALTSVPVSATMEGAFLSSGDREKWKGQLEAFISARAATTVPVDLYVAEGNAASKIIEQAESADMLVIGTHGRSGYRHALLGSVVEKVVRRASCPVLTIPPAATGTPSVPALFNHIVVAVDWSRTSLLALAYAVSLARESDSKLTVLQVVETPRELARWAGASEEGAVHVEQWKALAATRLHAVVTDAARTGCHVEERIETGQPYREILRVATEEHAGLIVLGAYGHGALERMFHGSTAQHVVREAICPVLTLREPAG